MSNKTKNPYISIFLDINIKAGSTFLARPNRKNVKHRLIPALFVVNCLGFIPRNYYFQTLAVL